MSNRRSKYFVLLVLFVSSASLSTAQSRNQLEEDGLRGPVKTIQVEAARISNLADGPTETGRIVLSKVTYDRSGNATSQLVNDATGAWRRENGWNHSYDNDGREIRTEYFDNKGRLTSIGITRYEEKRGSELTQFNPDGSVNHIWQSFFDDDAKLIRDVRRYPTGLGWEHLYKYDKQRRLIERLNRELGGRVVDKSSWTYDDHGTQTSWIVEKADGTSLQMFKSLFSYDAAGRIVERHDYDPDGSLFNKSTFTYEFDSKGNWTKLKTERQTFSRKALTYKQEVIHRQITYF